MPAKLGSLLTSRRFWVAIIGTAAIAAHEVFGVQPDQVEAIGMIVLAWVLGDSLRRTE